MLVQLLPFTEGDIPNLIAWVDKPGSSDLWASRTYPFPLTKEIILSHMQKTKKVPCELLIFKVIAEGFDKPVGHIELDKLDHHVKSSRITRLFVDPKYRNHGLGCRAVELLLQYCFEELNLNRVEILAVESNETALRLYEKMGFKKEGFLRENMLLNGKRQGSHLLSLLRDEYPFFDRQSALQGSLLKLLPLEKGDFEALYSVASDPLIWEQHPQKERHKRNVFEVFFTGAIDSKGAFLVYDKENNKVIGSSRFYDYSPTRKEITIGYTFLARSHWGGKFNREVKTLMLEHAFKYIDSVLFEIGENNLRSRRAIEKIGAQLIKREELDNKPHVVYKINPAQFHGALT